MFEHALADSEVGWHWHYVNSTDAAAAAAAAVATTVIVGTTGEVLFECNLSSDLIR